MTYRQQRDYENLQRGMFEGAGEYNIPILKPDDPELYNHYRKHWLGAYWQKNMVRVIPTISWSDRDSYTWCFDGEPEGGMVAVSTVGTQNSRETRRRFLEGYNEMLARLQPSRILMYGMIPDECQGNIIPVRAFQQRLKAYDK